MTPRLTRKEYEANKGEGNRRLMKALVDDGRIPGLLAYQAEEPVAWISIEPREEISSLSRSRILAPVDDEKVWSIVCLFIRKDQRRSGLSVRLIEACHAWAKRQGAPCIEAYPVEPKKDRMPDAFAWTGIAKSYLRAGFEEVARRSETRPVMRRRC